MDNYDNVKSMQIRCVSRRFCLSTMLRGGAALTLGTWEGCFDTRHMSLVEGRWDLCPFEGHAKVVRNILEQPVAEYK